jgi:hypothetical protein
MSKKALGRGMNALFSTEQQSSDLEVISSKLKPDAIEDISSNVEVRPKNSEVISNNLEDRTKTLIDPTDNVEVKTENLQVISSNSELHNIEGITYNSEVIRDALADAKQNPRISLWSPKSAAVLRYLRKTKPEFSISEEAGRLLEEAIKERYPELLKQVEKALAKK